MLNYLLIWASEHSTIILLCAGLSLWVAAYYWYFKDEWANYVRSRKPHRWSVDMETKTSRGGRKRVE
jgi:hypothetical protein